MMEFTNAEIEVHKVELKQEIKQIEKNIRDNPLDYGSQLKISNLYFILSELEDK